MNNYNKKKSKSKGKDEKVMTVGRIIFLTFLSLIFVLFLAINIFLYIYHPSSDSIPDIDILDFEPELGEGEDIESPQNPRVDMSKERNKDCYTFLIVGIDILGGTTDTMMVAMFNVKESTISILNIPRDTYVSTKNYSGKINGVYARGRNNAIASGVPRGEEASRKGLEYLSSMIKYTFGIEIQKYILIDLRGFKVLVDKIGGVEFNVPMRMKYTDPEQGLYIDLQPGWQHLDGGKAEQLIRFRHGDKGQPNYYDIGYPGEDIGRIKTQQHFMAALMKKVLAKPDVNTMKGLYEVGANYMVTNISVADAGWFATKMTNVKLENVRTHTVPGNWLGSVLRYEAYKAETMEIINRYYNPYRRDIPETNFNIYDRDLVGYTGYKPEIDIDGKTMDTLVK